MEFLEDVQWKFQKYHKKNNIPDRKKRTEMYKNEQKLKRTKIIDESRNLKCLTPSKSPEKVDNPRIDRLTRLKMWKEEKLKREKAPKKPIFKTGGAKDIGFPMLKSFVQKPQKEVKIPENKPLRVTRSTKPVASPPLPLPIKTRKKKIEKGNPKNKLARQNAIENNSEEELPETNNTSGEEMVKNTEKTPKNSKRSRKENVPEKNQKTPKLPKNVLNVITPENKGPYVSPFVTTRRGKGSVKKENLNRSLRGLQSFTEPSSPEVGAKYFTTVLNNEISRLEELCDIWSTFKDKNELNVDAQDLIDVAVGQARLLMNKKFKQFEDLIKACETGVGAEKEVTCGDLQGFWDMIYMQVNNLNTRFNNLTKMKENNWQEIEENIKPKETKKRILPKRNKPVSSSTGLRAAILAARKNKNGPSEETKEDISVFNGGFFVIKTPSKDTPNKPIAKATPKSILKNKTEKPIAILSKTVLFKDSSSETEETPSDETFKTVSPTKKERRSSRKKSLN